MSVSFGTKAETLEQLSFSLKTATVLPLLHFTTKSWQQDYLFILSKIKKELGLESFLIVRSSAKNEDTLESSMAGHYESVLAVQGEQELTQAIEKVIASYKNHDTENQILIQPMLEDTQLSGVAFSIDPHNGAPYYLINFDDHTGQTDTVTSGNGRHLKQYVHHLCSPVSPPNFLAPILDTLKELSTIFNYVPLDVEFAIDKNKQLYIFQVRPLVKANNKPLDIVHHTKVIHHIEQYMATMFQPHPYLYGQYTIYGVMPDWNPAEIIGIRPKTLALSLYQELVTDSVWAYQRDNYGYTNLRSFPLLINFGGLPYIDVRVSFNSFLPKKMSPNLSEKLVNYYLNQLRTNQILHDKIEFDIVFSGYTLDLSKRLEKLSLHGFSQEECDEIKSSLIHLTNSIIHNEHGFWKQDLEKIEILQERQHKIIASELPTISKLYWLIEDCKRYGTLPFAGLARAAFIAVQILKSFQSTKILTEEEVQAFLKSICTITSQMQNDLFCIEKNSFLEKYGHLRPGTYDITLPSYKENFKHYFGHHKKTNLSPETEKPEFKLSVSQLRKIQDHLNQDQIDIDVLDLFDFIKQAIEAREYSKFIFTKSISQFLELLISYGDSFGITRDECAYIHIKDLLSLYSSSNNPEQVLKESIKKGMLAYNTTRSINLPPLIVDPSQVWSFELLPNQANFITQNSALANIATIDQDPAFFRNAIVMISSADPGYDWVFSKGIVGLITEYGGANSHMAIRSAELNIPAVIGAGSVQYNYWKQAKRLLIDCLNHQVKVIL